VTGLGIAQPAGSLTGSSTVKRTPSLPSSSRQAFISSAEGTGLGKAGFGAAASGRSGTADGDAICGRGSGIGGESAPAPSRSAGSGGGTGTVAGRTGLAAEELEANIKAAASAAADSKPIFPEAFAMGR
jgi:hypothetical protein